MNKKRVYLDYAATTPTDKRVFEYMKPYFTEKFGNPMSLHQWGQEAVEAIEKSRKNVAAFLGAQPEEVVFTSGSTESNNLAVKGIVEAYKINNRNAKPHIITSEFEHHCILETCEKLAEQGSAEVTFIKPSENGIISLDDIKKAIKENTVLISLIRVNNEIGTIQPIEEMGKLLESLNKKRKQKIFLHTDATQSINYLDCNVDKMKVDLLSLSGHKVYGPKGVGALYVRKGIDIKRIQDGGEQEFGLRSGTHNVPGIVGLEKAIELISKNGKKERKKVKKLRDYLIKKVIKEIPDVRVNGEENKLAPHIVNFSFERVEGESLLLGLSMKGIAVSTGSACTSNSLKPSHVLLSIGLKPEQAHGSLRISLGRMTTKRELDYFIQTLKTTLKNLRKISGNILKDYYKSKQTL